MDPGTSFASRVGSRRVATAIAMLAAVSALLAGCARADRTHLIEGCEPELPQDHSVARVWNEALLDAIRRDFPAPTIHARNLFHTSAAMWDAWATYDPTATGYFVTEKHETADVAAARDAAISYAAYRLLLHRYSLAIGLEETFGDLVATMESLCYRIDYVESGGSSPAALGNRIADTIIEATHDDGSLETARYVDTTYRPINKPMVVAMPGTTMADPNRWQPLALEQQVAQNGLLVPGAVQTFVGPNWGYVEGFALPASSEGLPVDPGPPPYLDHPVTDAEFKSSAVDVIRFSSSLDPSSPTVIDIGPGSVGNNPLGTYAGEGHAVNPTTGRPYAPNVVSHADYGRVIAEFWADGPQSETPPGHWNTLANAIGDRLETRRMGATGDELDRLEWDVKLYFALNGAVHDAAIAAWGAKAHYDYPRPISMIRYMGGAGQSSDPTQPGYDPHGLPLEPGLVEVVTTESSAPGGSHHDLADHVGEVVLSAWRGSPDDPASQHAGVGWIRAVEWVPYQRPTFVTPAFAGYVSGHSTFSRAAAEVLAAATGSEFFPGGLFEWRVAAGSLHHENGPTEDVVLQWGTYYDAADEAGISRLYGGIHVAADDVRGRVMGSAVGKQAWELALDYFDGVATSP